MQWWRFVFSRVILSLTGTYQSNLCSLIVVLLRDTKWSRTKDITSRDWLNGLTLSSPLSPWQAGQQANGGPSFKNDLRAKDVQGNKRKRHLTGKAESKLKPVEIPSSGFTTLSHKVCQIKRTNKPCNKTLPSGRSRVHPGQVPVWMSDTLSSNISLAALW